MKRDERWLSEETREGNPWLDHVRSESQHDRPRLEMQFPTYILERLEFFLRLVRRCHAKMSNIFVRSTRAETWFFSVSTMLIAFVIFWMSLTSVILAGLNLIWTFLITSVIRSGRRMSTFANNMRERFSASPVDQETESVRLRTTSTSAATPDSNSSI